MCSRHVELHLLLPIPITPCAKQGKANESFTPMTSKIKKKMTWLRRNVIEKKLVGWK